MPRKRSWKKAVAAKTAKQKNTDKNLKADVGLVPSDGSGPTSVPQVVEGLVPTTMTSVSAGVGLVPTPVTAGLGLVSVTASNAYDFTSDITSDITYNIKSNTTNCDETDHADNSHQENVADSHCALKELQTPSLFNAVHLMFGLFSQGDARFSESTRDKQCLCNALIYLAKTFDNVNRTVIDLDKVLILGDQLYKKTVNNLKKSKKLRNILLNFDEIPQVVDTGEKQYDVVKHEIFSGAAVDVNNLGLPTMHNAILDGLNQS